MNKAEALKVIRFALDHLKTGASSIEECVGPLPNIDAAKQKIDEVKEWTYEIEKVLEIVLGKLG